MPAKLLSKRIPVAILVRVSTDKQDTSRQVHELRQVAEEKGWEVVEVIDESGGTCTRRSDEVLIHAFP
ncbi:MAG: recombinase family protein [bacterium]